MTTTAVFTEILIAGLEAAVWMSLLIVAVFNLKSVQLDVLKGWEAIATVLVLAAAYVLGVLVDRLADDLRFWVDDNWPGRPVDRLAEIMTMRLAVMRQGGDLSEFLDYQRSRMRVMRATVFNLVVAIPVAFFFLAERMLPAWEIFAVLAILLALAFIGLLEYRKLEFAYISALSEAYKLLCNLQDGIDIAAAVPYRIANGKLEFRLVQTKDGKYWTFPKGHRKTDKGETLPEAAAREAREEAGVHGRINARRLTEFLYPNGLDPQKPDRIAAYLLNCRRQTQPRSDEQGRDPTWLSPVEACERLAAGGREAEYARGLQEVVQLAARKVAHDQDTEKA